MRSATRIVFSVYVRDVRQLGRKTVGSLGDCVVNQRAKRSRDGSCEHGWNSVADLSRNMKAPSREHMRIREALNSRSFTECVVANYALAVD